MTRDQFLAQLGEVLDLAGPLAPGQSLQEIDTFDSLGVLNILAIFDQLGLTVQPEQVVASQTADDLVALAAGKLEG